MPADGVDAPRPGESPEQRVDRNLTELLSELRVALPGVQVLFAFLLVVPFNQRFSTADQFARTTYYLTLLLATAASVFLIAPSFHHRLQFRQAQKERVVLTGNALAIIGLVLLAFAMTGVVLLVTEYVFDKLVATVTASTVGVLFLAIWFVLPLSRRLRRRERERPVNPG